MMRALQIIANEGARLSRTDHGGRHADMAGNAGQLFLVARPPRDDGELPEHQPDQAGARRNSYRDRPVPLLLMGDGDADLFIISGIAHVSAYCF